MIDNRKMSKQTLESQQKVLLSNVMFEHSNHI